MQIPAPTSVVRASFGELPFSFRFSPFLLPSRRSPSRLTSSRLLRRVHRCQKLLVESLEASTSACQMGYIGNKNSSYNAELVDQTYFSHVEEVSAENSQINADSVSGSGVHGSLKFLVLFGLLNVQDSQQAIAGTEFLSGVPAISSLGNLGDISSGFASAFLLIFFSELGDKTFFIAALLAARNSGAIVFLGTFGALATMTVVSVLLGRTFHYIDEILPFKFGETDLPIDDIAAVCLLVYFGVTTLIDAASADDSKAIEEQKEAELAVSKLSGSGAGIMAATSTVISTFLLVFVAEWGDKSFFSTIALAAAASPLGVIGGALGGHAVATLLAVIGGSLLGSFFSEKVISYVGGTLFLVFAAVTLMEIVR